MSSRNTASKLDEISKFYIPSRHVKISKSGPFLDVSIGKKSAKLQIK
jgi:hypothetical protein